MKLKIRYGVRYDLEIVYAGGVVGANNGIHETTSTEPIMTHAARLLTDLQALGVTLTAQGGQVAILPTGGGDR